MNKVLARAFRVWGRYTPEQNRAMLGSGPMPLDLHVMRNVMLNSLKRRPFRRLP